MRRSDGTLARRVGLGQPDPEATGRVVGFRGVVRDVTESRARGERLQAALYRIAELAVGRPRTWPASTRPCTAIVGELMYARNFYIALFDEASGRQLSLLRGRGGRRPPAIRRRPRASPSTCCAPGEPLLASPAVFTTLVAARRGRGWSAPPPSTGWACP